MFKDFEALYLKVNQYAEDKGIKPIELHLISIDHTMSISVKFTKGHYTFNRNIDIEGLKTKKIMSLVFKEIDIISLKT